MTPQQAREVFLLVSKQLHAGFELSEAAAAGDYTSHTSPHMTTCHLIGISSYVTELMSMLQLSLREDSRL